MLSKLKALMQYVRDNRFTRGMMRYFDWPLFLIVVAISLFGIVCVFSATSSEVTQTPSTVMEMLETQSIYYPRLQFLWLLAGIAVMMVMIFLPYQLFGRYAQWIYIANIAVLLLTLLPSSQPRRGIRN